MSCVVAVRDKASVMVGRDSFAGAGDWYETRVNAKVFRLGPLVIGCCGEPRVSQLVRCCMSWKPSPVGYLDFESFLMTDFIPSLKKLLQDNGCTWREDECGGETMRTQMVVAWKGDFAVVEGDYQVCLPSNLYSAIGAGASAALGALHALDSHGGLSGGNKVRSALEAAEACCVSVRRPFVLLGTESQS